MASELVSFASQTVVTGKWEVDVDDMATVVRVPDFNHLSFVNPENNKASGVLPGSALYRLHNVALYRWHDVVQILVHLARITHWYRTSLPAFHTTAGSYAGLRFLHDEIRTTIDLGRARVRNVELYERSLRISRKKGSERIVVRTIPTQDLLNITVWTHDTYGLANVLGVYWRQKHQGVIGFAEFSFDYPDTLEIWAAFLSANLQTTEEVGRYKIPALPREMSLGDQDLRGLTDLKLQHIFHLIPLAIQGELDLYSMESLNLHLVRVARKVFALGTRVDA